MASSASSSNPSGTMDVIVYFKDKHGLRFEIRKDKNYTAGELFEMVMDEMHFPPIAREVFSLWLVSDLLEVQLRPTQVPFHLACFWVELLQKYTSSSICDAQADEPIISFQRNTFFPLESEKQLSLDVSLTRLLYHEAKENVLDERYVLTSSGKYHELAGLQALIAYKGFDRHIHTPSFYRDKLGDFYPCEVCQQDKKWSRIFTVDEPMENILTHWHAAAASLYTSKGVDLKSDVGRNKCYRDYLNHCWVLRTYGAAYFRGQVQRKGMHLMSTKDLPVYVACNSQGITVIDMDGNIPLIWLSYKQFFWEYAEPSGSDPEKDVLPCIFIYLTLLAGGTIGIPKCFQIFTRESVMIDATMKGFLTLAKLEQPSSLQEVHPVDPDANMEHGEKLVFKDASVHVK